MRTRTPSIALAILCLLFFIENAHSKPFSDCTEFVKFGAPNETGDLLCRRAFALAHNPTRKTPDWVAERLTHEKVSAKKIPRTPFRADAELEKGQRAEPSDYSNSGYDQGHLAPAADMYWSKQAMKESHYLSNIAPQVGVGMNQHIWADLELVTRQWTLNRGELFVFTGPIYKTTNKTIGKNKVAVPTHFYKVIFDPLESEAIAFIMPNKKLKRTDLHKYAVSVDQVEAATGLDFLSTLSEQKQKEIESKTPRRLWQVCDPDLPMSKYLKDLLCPGD